MPTLVKKFNPPRWRAVVTVNGNRKEKLFPDGSEKSRRAAEKWEEAQRKTLKTPEPIVTDSLTLLNLSNSFLDFVKERQSRQTYVEKLAVMTRTIKRFGGDTLVADIQVADAMKFLSDQNRTRSGYAANKERKVLVTAWGWGKKYMPGFPDGPCPFQVVDRFPEQRQPRYVPPEDDFWAVDGVAEGQDRVMLLTFLFLAARRGEIQRIINEAANRLTKQIPIASHRYTCHIFRFDTQRYLARQSLGLVIFNEFVKQRWQSNRAQLNLEFVFQFGLLKQFFN